MVNGEDKNLRRLEITCAAYRQKYKEWPAEARMPALLLWDLARFLDSSAFELLAARIRLRTRDELGLSVGGSRGVVEYDDVVLEELAQDRLQLAVTWLGVRR